MVIDDKLTRFRDKKWLEEQYVKSTISLIAKRYSVSPMFVMDCLESHGIGIRGFILTR
jgi:hypothetical protein